MYFYQSETWLRMKNIFWTGYTHQDRNMAISALKEIINLHGWIVDFKPLSDISLTFVIEIAESKIDSLFNMLKDNIVIGSFELLNSNSERERVIYLNITFTKGTGDLKIEVPAIPG